MELNPHINSDLETIIGNAILQHKSFIGINRRVTQDDVRKAIRIFMRKHPEIFWFSHQYHFDESNLTLNLKYNFTYSKRIFYTNEINNSVRFLFQPENLKNLSDLEKVTYVYKWIAGNTTYDEYSSFNQTIYSVLINRNSVCTGYAKTAQYLLGKIGVESQLIFGKFHADRSYGGRHGWNIVKIDGKWYHVDFCLADISLKHLLNAEEDPVEHEGLMWNYFCKPTEYMLKNRSIEFIEYYPECINSIDKRINIKLARPLKQLAVCKSDSGTTSKIYLDSFNKNQVIKKATNHTSLIANENEILRRLNGCKHIVRLKDLNEYGLTLEQLTPWKELFNSHYYRLTGRKLRDILIQLTEGLIECRDRGISYSDIHYNNVLVTKDELYKWCDFGIAFRQSDIRVPFNLIGSDGIPLGSRWFMAPETYKNHIFTEKSAIYSLAMLAYFIMNDMRPPFFTDSKSTKDALNKRLAGEFIPPPKNASSFLNFSILICEILNSQLLDRPHTYESFINLLKFENLNLAHITADDNIILNNSKISDEVDIPSNRNEYQGPNLINDDFFARTMSGFIPAKTLNENPKNHPGVQRDRRRPRGVDAIPPSPPYSACPPASSPNSHSPKYGSFIKKPKTVDKIESYYPQYRPIAPDFQQTVAYQQYQPTLGIRSVISKIVNFGKGMFSKNSDRKNTQEIQQEIDACIYAPAEIMANVSFIIRVYMYRPHDRNKVDLKIREIDPTAVKKEYKPLDLPVKEGDKLTVQLDLSDSVQCESTSKTVIWRNHYIDCSFLAKLTDVNQKNIEGKVNIFINDIPAGEMLFIIDVVANNPRDAYTKIDSRQFSKIFISYAHKDESQVRGIAEGCRMLGKDYFFDRHTLQTGDLFKEKILNYIDSADLFVLCWSKNAAESKWVQIEREHAMRLIHEGKTSLTIYPLSLRPEAPLPLDMSDKYNFGKL